VRQAAVCRSRAGFADSAPSAGWLFGSRRQKNSLRRRGRPKANCPAAIVRQAHRRAGSGRRRPRGLARVSL